MSTQRFKKKNSGQRLGLSTDKCCYDDLSSEVETILAGLTLEQKIGHMIMGRGLSRYSGEVAAMIKAGLMCNIQAGIGPDEPQQLAEIQKSLPLPMLVGADMEWGFNGGFLTGVALPNAMAIGAIDDEQVAYDWAAMAAREAREYGVNMVYGPVVDFATNPKNPMGNIRLIGGNPDIVIRLASAMVRGYQDNGMLVSAKHYPNAAGRPEVDNHIEQGRLLCDRPTFANGELRVYRELVKRAALSGVMSGHVLVPSLDPENMATTSPILVQALRDQGFEGVLMTDSLAMKGLRSFIKHDELLPAVMASGHDLILIDYAQAPEEQYQQLLVTVKSGRVSENTIDISVRRILKAKLRIARSKPAPADRAAHQSAALTMSRRAVSMRGDFSVLRRRDWTKNTLIIIAREEAVSEVKTELANKTQFKLEQYLHAEFPECTLLNISDSPAPLEMERTLAATLEYQHVVFVTYALFHSYKGTADLSRPLLAMISGLAHKIDCLVLFGNPFAARHLPELPAIVFPYWGGAAEQAAVETLAGRNEPKGKLPVKW